MINLKKPLITLLINFAIFTMPFISHGQMLENITHTVEVSDSIKLKKITENYGFSANEFNILEVDMNNTNNNIDILFNPQGFSKTMNITKTAGQTDEVVAAVNGDFFIMSSPSSPLGAVVKDKKVLSNPYYEENKFANMIVEDGNNITFAYLNNALYVDNMSKGTSIMINNINKAVDPEIHYPVIFTSEYTQKTLGASEKRKDYLEVMVNSSGIVTQMREDMPQENIEYGGFAILAKGEAANFIKNNISVGDVLKINLDITKNNPNINTIVGGGTLLIKDGAKTPITQRVKGKSQRTAIGVTDDNKLLIVTSDGRQPSVPGLEEEDMQNFMYNLRVKDAIMLDGGGSTNLYYDGIMQNTQTSERNVSNAISIKNNSSGQVSKVNISVLEDIIFTGKEIEFSASAVDNMGNNISRYKTPDFFINVSGVDGTVNGRYITFKTSGKATVTASINGVSASTDVYVNPSYDKDDKYVYNLTSINKINVFGNTSTSRNLIAKSINAQILKSVNNSEINITSHGTDEYFKNNMKSTNIYQGYENSNLIPNTTIMGINNDTASGELIKNMEQVKKLLAGSSKNVMLILSGDATMPNKYLQHYFDKILLGNKDKNIYVIYKSEDGKNASYKRGNASYISVIDSQKFGDIDKAAYLSIGLNENLDLIYTFKRIFN